MRDARIPADGWVDAPAELVELGSGIGARTEYKRRIGRFLLWRAGPPVGESRYFAIDPDSGESYRFDLHGRAGEGRGPDGLVHRRFRSWKEALRDSTEAP